MTEWVLSVCIFIVLDTSTPSRDRCWTEPQQTRAVCIQQLHSLSLQLIDEHRRRIRDGRPRLRSLLVCRRDHVADS